MTPKELALRIDHTCLDPTAGKKEITKLCEEAKMWGFQSIYVPPDITLFAKKEVSRLFADSLEKKPGIYTVGGFPHGRQPTEIKVAEVVRACGMWGASGVDLVMNYAKLKDQEYRYVQEEIRQIIYVAYPAMVKVIIEICCLTKKEVVTAVKIIQDAGGEWVKTATGFGTRKTTTEDITLIRGVAWKKTKIKASGGIRTYTDALSMIEAGANRIGTSNSVAIMEEAKKQNEKTGT